MSLNLYPIAMASQNKAELERFLNQSSAEIYQKNPLSAIQNNLHVHEKMRLRTIVWMNNASLGDYGSFGIQSNQNNGAGLPTIMINLMKNTTVYLLHNCDLSFDFTYSPGNCLNDLRGDCVIYYDDEETIQFFSGKDAPPTLPDAETEIHATKYCVLV